MTGKTIDLEFDGYWREANKASVPAQSGIYCVYICKYNKSESNLTIKKLIYIGESANVRTRLASHNRLEDWKKHLNSGETLCYSVAKVPELDRVRAEAALIHKHTPPENSEYTGEYTYNKTAIETSGKKMFLHAAFTVGE